MDRRFRRCRRSAGPGIVIHRSQALLHRAQVRARQWLARRTAMLATIARFCVRRRRWVLAAWMLLFVAGITIGSMVFGRLHYSNGSASYESVQGYNIIQKATTMGPTAVVLVKGPPVASPAT